MTAQQPMTHDPFVRQRAGGWIISLCLHGTALVLAGLLVAKMGLAPPSSSFHWDVTVVASPTATRTTSTPTHESAVARSTTRPSQRSVPVTPAGPAATRSSSLRTTASTPLPLPVEPQIAEPTTPPTIQQVQPAPEAVTPPPPSLPEPATKELPPPAPVPQAIVESASAHEQIVATPPSPEAIPTPAPAFSSASRDHPSDSGAPPTQTAALVPSTPNATEAKKPDYGWLAASLLPRIESLKHYPAEARVKRLEGRVLVRIVVQEDGQIVSTTIAKSSGHDILDQAALETMQKSSPILLTQPLEKSSVTLQIPINYRLAR